MTNIVLKMEFVIRKYVPLMWIAQEIIHAQMKVNAIMLHVLRILNVKMDITAISMEYANILVLTVKITQTMNASQVSSVLPLMVVVTVLLVQQTRIVNSVKHALQMFVQVQHAQLMVNVVIKHVL
jgi:hypothetical protein